jgi:hypothetical protein
MKHCKRCGAENPEIALYCKECGGFLNEDIVPGTIAFKHTWRKVNLLIKITLSFFPVLLIILFIFFSLDYNEDLILSYWDWTDLAASTSLIFMFFLLMSSFAFFFFHLRWKVFELRQPFGKVKEQLKVAVFIINKAGENIRIKEDKKGELKLKDKALRTRGCYYILKDKKEQALLVGEKYNTMAFIRSVFGKDINFIEN